MEKEDIKGEIIAEIKVSGMWGKKNISWKPDPHVNILVGINGSGKTTLLNILNEILLGTIIKTKPLFQSAFLISSNGTRLECNCDVAPKSDSNRAVEISVMGQNHYSVSKISTFDIPRESTKNSPLFWSILGIESILATDYESTELDLKLKEIINGDGLGNINFIKLDAINSDEEKQLLRAGETKGAAEIQRKQSDFLALIDSFFAKTEKKIYFTTDKDIIFKNGDEKIALDKLSAGEKQLLIILFSVYLQQRKPYILLLDEPEISLHLEWQSKLIDTILALNPNCQLFIATHSPSMFGKGWGDKIVNIESITTA